MKMTYRWYGESNDPIPLKSSKQIPNCPGIMGVLGRDGPMGGQTRKLLLHQGGLRLIHVR